MTIIPMAVFVKSTADSSRQAGKNSEGQTAPAAAVFIAALLAGKPAEQVSWQLTIDN